MKFAALGALAALFLAMPAHAAKEFDCPPTQEVQNQRNELQLSDDLVQRRQQVREAEIARLKERLMRGSAVAQTAAPAQPDTVR